MVGEGWAVKRRVRGLALLDQASDHGAAVEDQGRGVVDLERVGRRANRNEALLRD